MLGEPGVFRHELLQQGEVPDFLRLLQWIQGAE